MRTTGIIVCLGLAACTDPAPTDVTINTTDTNVSIEATAPDLHLLFPSNKRTSVANNVLCILEDRYGHLWFGTQRDGVYHYDGKTVLQFTSEDGLFQDQVQFIQEDTEGNVWYTTGGYGVSRFNGETFETVIAGENMGPGEWPGGTTAGDLWFYAGAGPFHYNDGVFQYLPFPIENGQQAGVSNRAGPYGLYAILEDSNGHLWFGTQAMGVCHYDGEFFTWLSDKGLAGPAVVTIFEDSKGILWFGNNGNGVFRYDPVTKALSNFTEEEGLANPEFRKDGTPGPGTLARPWSINEDNDGHLWIGTADAGAWCYDGTSLKNYTMKDGLTSDEINFIYKDKKGILWFGTTAALCKFDGTSFVTIDFNEQTNY